MTTSWSQAADGTITLTYRPGFGARLFGVALLAVGLYFFWTLLVWLYQSFGPGGAGMEASEILGLLLVILMAAAFGVPGALMTFYGGRGRVEPSTRRVVKREGILGRRVEKVFDVPHDAKVAVRVRSEHHNTDAATSTHKEAYTIVQHVVTIEPDEGQPIEVGVFNYRGSKRAHALTEDLARALQLEVIDRAKPRVRKEDAMTSAFLKTRGIDAPPGSPLVKTIRWVRLVIESLLS